MVTEVGVAELRSAQSDGAVVVDVREPQEYAAGHVPGARNIPLSVVPVRMHELPRSERLFVICASGGRSYQAAQVLDHAGYRAVSVDGGTSAWIRAGQPVATGSAG